MRAVVALCSLLAASSTVALPTDFVPNVKHPNRLSTVARLAGEKVSITTPELRSGQNLTGVNLWPVPLSYHTVNSRAYYMTPDTFSFKAAGAAFGSSILEKAFDRYRPLCFPWGPGIPANIPAPSSEVFPLSGLVVDVASDDDYLGLATNETYTLTVIDDGTVATATITAPNVYAALRGLETFSQLVQYNQHLQTYQMGAADVVDSPRYPYRGIMLDVSRHYISLSTILATLDVMSWNKMNVMHLHLIDDQSWPLIIDAYPRLAGWCAYSNFSHIYTKSDVATIVSYAKDRGIRVIPEIDTPSHSDIIKNAYPEYLTLINCDGNDCPKGHTFRSMPDPTNPKTWAFLTQIFTEVAEMFPDEAFHIGGDEFWGAWDNAPAVQAFNKEHNYTSIYDTYHYYERQVIQIIRSLGKKNIVAWEDIHGFQELHQGDTTNYADWQDVVLDVWTGWPVNPGTWQSSFEQYVGKNASVILTGPWYIDSRSHKIYDTTWDGFYKTNPGNWSGTPAQQKKVLGGHVCAWDDAINGDSGNVLTLMFPQSAAVAEVLWSPESITSQGPGQAHGRMVAHRCRLVQRQVPAATVEIGFCPVEYESPTMGPLASNDIASTAVSAAEAMQAEIAALQQQVLALKQENARLSQTSFQ